MCAHTPSLRTSAAATHTPAGDYQLAMGALTGAGMFVGAVVAGRIVTLNGGVRARPAQVGADGRVHSEVGRGGGAKSQVFLCPPLFLPSPSPHACPALPAVAQIRDIATQFLTVAVVTGIGEGGARGRGGGGRGAGGGGASKPRHPLSIPL